ncbi:MAG: pentapeptide repeat-containing protein [Flammeovirgaceae bacterium]|nr:pentapeptide repeat-containing protein [Flammeovirgaceae bacterium]
MVFTNPVNYRYKPIGLLNCDSSIFNQKVDFFSSNIKCTANFPQTTFHAQCNFKKANFKNDVDFKGSQFNDAANFCYVKATEAVDFSGSEFHGNALFWMSSFSNEINLSDVDFRQDAFFMGSHFQSVFCENSHFQGETGFEEVAVNDSLVFSEVKFSKEVRFNDARLGHHLILNRVRSDHVLRFTGAFLPDTMEIKNCALLLPIDFDSCFPNPNGKCLVYLENTDPEDVWMDFRLFEIWFLPNNSMGFNERKKVFDKFLKLEEKRNRTESLSALKTQYTQFLNRESGMDY